MAKRKRLTPATLTETPPAPETKGFPYGVAQHRAPIAQVAGEAATKAALDELAGEVRSARAEGRMVQMVPLGQIRADHLLRDRISANPEDMAALKASLLARGQQTPIEVIDLGDDAYGLISGWRRLQAFQEIHAETGKDAFAAIQVLIKKIDTVSDSYVAMVEENEIRADLSYYERARLASEAVRLGVYPNVARAVQVLFANASAAKRSKIGGFVKLHEAVGQGLRFGPAIPERLGLALVAGFEADPGLAARLKDALRKTPPETAAHERATLERALRKHPAKKPATAREITPGVMLETRKGRAVLSGKGVTEDLLKELETWLSHAKRA